MSVDFYRIVCLKIQETAGMFIRIILRSAYAAGLRRRILCNPRNLYRL